MKLLSLLLFLLQVLVATVAYNYCNNASHLCNKSFMKHFVCHLDSELRPLFNTAKYVATVPDTPHLRDLFLSYHNKYRDSVASGNLVTDSNETLPAASRMRELIWDTELAYLARLHASTVSFKHSVCRSVLRFPHVGETLGMAYPTTNRRTIIELLDLMLLPMFEEYRAVGEPKKLVREFNILTQNNVGHFALISSDRLSRVGCAIAAASDCDEQNTEGFCHFITCHYDFTNIAGEYIYKVGAPKSQCCVWKASRNNKKYNNLCSNPGKIFPKEHGKSNEGNCTEEY